MTTLFAVLAAGMGLVLLLHQPVRSPDGWYIAAIGDLRPIAATDYRLIGLAPGDLPIVSVRTSAVDLYALDLDE